MKTTITTKEINYIKKVVNKYGVVSICIGEISPIIKNKLEKYFILEKDFFGYIKFTNKNKKYVLDLQNKNRNTKE